jgi:enoyl-CoA hydratase/carnithine racemase
MAEQPAGNAGGDGGRTRSGGPVGYEVVEAVAHVTIERPAAHNAMDLEVFDGLRERAAEAAADPGVGAVVVSGGGGVFSSGIDLAVLGSGLADGLDPSLVARLQAAFTAYEDLEVPTVAAIEGHCYGAGAQLALACHLRAVAPSVRFGLLEVRWGLIPDLGATWRLPRLVGLGRATELIVRGRTIGAQEALQLGVAEIALGGGEDGGDPQREAHEVAARLAGGPAAVRRVVRLARENLGRDRVAALDAEARTQVELVAGHDVREALAAHREGRAPTFRGS